MDRVGHAPPDNTQRRVARFMRAFENPKTFSTMMEHFGHEGQAV